MQPTTSLIAGFLLLSGSCALAQPFIEADPSQARAEAQSESPQSEPSGSASGLPSYAGLRGSYAFNGNSVTTYAPTSPPTALRASYASGGGGSVYIGTRLPLNFRLELEAMARWQPLSRVSLNGASFAGSGYTKMAAPMLNLLWDVPLPDDFGIQPFVGMGVGAAYSMTDANDGAPGDVYLHRDKWDLAYSFIGGFALPLSDSSRVTAMYRWMQLRDAGVKCAVSGSLQSVCLDTNINSSSVDLGFELDM